MNVDTTGLWRFNKITGYWVLERSCSHKTAAAWLTIFQDDAPNEVFVVSERRPTCTPQPKSAAVQV